jgi:hypothetical protein
MLILFVFKLIFDPDLQNAFMSVVNSDPHAILTFDQMHSDGHGLGGQHIFPAVVRYTKASGRDKLADLDQRSLYSTLSVLFFNYFILKFQV